MNLCLNCRRRLLTCVCHLIKPFETKSRFLILMHPMEYKKEKVGTGRFSHLILKNSHVIVDVNFDDNLELKSFLCDSHYETFLLYPGDQVINLSQVSNSFTSKTSKNIQIIIIDGTWPCAKKMVKLSTILHDLPRLSFDTKITSRFKIKHQPMPGCLSTVESIYQVIFELNRLGLEKTLNLENNLLDVFDYTVNQQIELAKDETKQGYRRRPFTSPDSRRISKKWNERLLFFKK